MQVEGDFRELLKLFNKHKVKYCVVGAFALAYHAKPRYTKDMDILIEPTVANGEKITAALREFGFANLKLVPEDFAVKGKFIQLGYEPVRVDIITSVKGLKFDEVWKNRSFGIYGDEKVNIIGLKDFLKSKRAAGRPQDRIDLDVLLSFKPKRKKP